VAYAAEQLDFVLLERHARAAAMTCASSEQLVRDLIGRDCGARRQSLEHSDQRRTV
jgi:hypothetical protein